MSFTIPLWIILSKKQAWPCFLVFHFPIDPYTKYFGVGVDIFSGGVKIMNNQGGNVPSEKEITSPDPCDACNGRMVFNLEKKRWICEDCWYELPLDTVEHAQYLKREGPFVSLR